MPAVALHKDLSDEQKQFIEKFVERASLTSLSEALEIPIKLVKSYYGFLKKHKGVRTDRKNWNMNSRVLKEILSTGTESPMLRKFFIRRDNELWSPQEDSFLWDVAGEKPLHEIALLLGRTETTVRFRMSILGINEIENSGHWTVKDVVQTTNFSLGLIRKCLRNGKLNRIPLTGKNVKSIIVPIGKLRYRLKHRVRGHHLPVSSCLQYVRTSNYSQILLEEKEVQRFLNEHYPHVYVKCIYCDDSAQGSLYCDKCFIEPEPEEETLSLLDQILGSLERVCGHD